MAIKTAHSVVITPKRCGLYETTRELVAALRTLGVDARMFDPNKEKNHLYPKGTEDRGAPFADMDFVKEADIIVNHSGLGETLEKMETPIIHMAHGRPRSSFLSEVKGDTPIYSYHYHKNKDPRFKAIVTFWPQHKPYLEVMFSAKPVYSIPAPVDLEAWSPIGPRGYGFHGKKGSCNVVCSDAWRDDIDPYPVVCAFALYARKFKGARLHIYGAHKDLRGWSPLLKSIQDQGNLGEVLTWVDGLAHVYRAADLMITPHTIAVRSMREAMACGCPVASMESNDLLKFVEKMEITRVQDQREVRAQAETLFNPTNTAKEVLEICRRVLNG